jgi:hypothetical protein
MIIDINTYFYFSIVILGGILLMNIIISSSIGSFPKRTMLILEEQNDLLRLLFKQLEIPWEQMGKEISVQEEKVAIDIKPKQTIRDRIKEAEEEIKSKHKKV